LQLEQESRPEWMCRRRNWSNAPGQSELQMLEFCLSKCLAAADEVLVIIEQFTDEDLKF
jgi:hypothetical protein